MPQLPTSLEYELAIKPRCGLCAYYPITAKRKHYCPIIKQEITRLTQPPRKWGQKTSHNFNYYLCFQPLTQIAYEARLEIVKQIKARKPQHFRLIRVKYKTEEERKEAALRWRLNSRDKRLAGQKRYHETHREQENEYKRNKRRANPEKHRQEVKDWNKCNPEYKLFRREIEKLDPLYIINHRFKYTPKGGTGLDELLALEAIDFAPIEPYIPQDIPEIVIGYSGTDQRGGIQMLWKSHQNSYRKRNLKFARMDMV